MAIVAIDFGSTHCKAGLFAPDGTALKIASRPTPTQRAPAGWAYLDPGEIQGVFADALSEVLAGFDGELVGVGITSMAETGVLVDRRSGATVSPLLPWFEPASQGHAQRVAGQVDAFDSYQKFGLQLNFKSPLSKILWWRETHAADIDHLIWLSAADYLAAWLTGEYRTDYSLAGRTGCFRVDRKAWDEEWLRVWDLPVALFPPAVASGSVVGEVVRADCGLPAGTPVAICGHDHLCAAASMGAVAPGVVFDSMGTAEVMIGVLPERPLTRQDYENGLLYGCHIVPGMGYWMGSLSASGGSVEWLRGLLGVEPLSYAALQGLVDSADPGPTGILYFPYLLGGGAPHADPNARAALVGLKARHRAPDLAKAVLEGAAYEMEIIRRAGERMLGRPIEAVTVAGGGARNRAWMQIKADVSGCTIEVSAQPEATLLGAALLVGVENGIYPDLAGALAQTASARRSETFYPDPSRHLAYRELFVEGYSSLQSAVMKFQTRIA